MDVIETSRLILNNFRASDVEEFYRICKDPEVGPNAGWTPHRSARESAIIISNFMERGNVWAVRRKEDDRLMGTLALNRLSSMPCFSRTMGYSLGKEYWGMGYGTEAARAALHYAFLAKNYSIVKIAHFPNNFRSKRVIEKCGFTLEGLIRYSFRHPEGYWLDEVSYSMLAEQFVELYPDAPKRFFFKDILYLSGGAQVEHFIYISDLQEEKREDPEQ